ncbi:MAG: hypothetical protein K9M07_07495 [Simkaniaceae bacterium]|nr:hypothetical protein [Simkaniaceae bacterium]
MKRTLDLTQNSNSHLELFPNQDSSSPAAELISYIKKLGLNFFLHLLPTLEKGK